MRSFISLLTVFTVLIATSTAQDEKEVSEAKEMLRGLAAECKASEGATDEDVQRFVDDEPPETRTQKCLTGCMQQQFGISDGKAFQEDGFLELARMLMKGDESKMELAKEIAADCKGVKNDDRCDLGEQILNCLKESAEKHGIELKH